MSMKSLVLSFVLALPAVAAEVPPVLPVGSPAPDFTLPGIYGKNWSLADFKDSKVLCLVIRWGEPEEDVCATGGPHQIPGIGQCAGGDLRALVAGTLHLLRIPAQQGPLNV